MPLTTTIPLKLGTTQVSRFVSGEGVGLAWGGTGVDLSASGGATFVLAQDAAHVISARALVAADIPTLDASKIGSGTIALARLSGITTTQIDAAAGITSGQIASLAFSKLAAGTMALATGASIQTTIAGNYILNIGGALSAAGDSAWAIGRYGAAAAVITQSGVCSQGGVVYYNCPTGYYHYMMVAGTTVLSLGAAGGAQGDTRWALGGFGYSTYSATLAGIVSTSATSLDMGVASTGAMKKYFAGVEKYRFSASLCEFDRLSLGGTIGSSGDPGAGGLALTGSLQLGSTLKMQAASITQTATTRFALASTFGFGVYTAADTGFATPLMFISDGVTGNFGKSGAGCGYHGFSAALADIGSGTSGIRMIANDRSRVPFQWIESSSSLVATVSGQKMSIGAALYDITAGTTGLRMINNAAAQVFFNWDDAGTLLTLGWGAWSGCKVVSKFGFGVTPVAQQTGGAATATASYTATEQSMLQKAYDCLRSFGFLS